MTKEPTNTETAAKTSRDVQEHAEALAHGGRALVRELPAGERLGPGGQDRRDVVPQLLALTPSSATTATGRPGRSCRAASWRCARLEGRHRGAGQAVGLAEAHDPDDGEGAVPSWKTMAARSPPCSRPSSPWPRRARPPRERSGPGLAVAEVAGQRLVHARARAERGAPPVAPARRLCPGRARNRSPTPRRRPHPGRPRPARPRRRRAAGPGPGGDVGVGGLGPDRDVGALGQAGVQLVEGLAHRVGQHEGPGDEGHPDGRPGRRSGPGRTLCIRPGCQEELEPASVIQPSRLMVPGPFRGWVRHLVDTASVGEEHHPVA